MATISQNRWDRVSILLQDLVDRQYYPNFAVRVCQHGQVVYEHCCGWMDVEARKPVGLDTIFRIYSMTKPVTCAAALTLFEEGKFSLEEPVSTYIPAFQNLKVYAGQDEQGIKTVDVQSPVTIRQLFTHTAGLGYGILEGPVEDLFRQSGIFDAATLTPVFPLEKMVEKITQLPLAFQPGTTWSYSLSHFVLGYLVSLISGMPFDEYLRQRIFEPLGMGDTGFWVPPEKQERLTAIYAYEEPGKLRLIEKAPDSPFARPAVAPAGGEGLVSTVGDYMRFARMLLNGGTLDGARVLSRKTVELMRSNHLTPELLPFSLPPTSFWGHGYGLGGMMVLDRAAGRTLLSNGTFGWAGAAGTDFFIDPQEDLAAVLMTQTQTLASSPTPPLWDLFERMVCAAIE
jgi:CubicO group peptidase (beta-lactamase class C family)